MKRAFDGRPIAEYGGELGSTKILDLNDDCLRECFEYFNLTELTEVADACSRFRRIAQMHFRTTEYKRLESRILGNIYTVYIRRGMLGVSKVLRNFGASIVSIDAREFGSYIFLNKMINRTDTQRASKIEKKFIELICQYCGDSLEELKCKFLILEDDLAQKLQPLIPQLKRLHLRAASPELVLKLLPKTNVWKVENLCLCVRDLGGICDQLLPQTPQLKKLEIKCASVGGGLFQPIAKHLPMIENIEYYRNNVVRLPVDFEYLGELRKLKTLAISGSGNGDCFQALAVMAANGVPLEHLKLRQVNLFSDSHFQHSLESISKFKNLKSLGLFGIESLSASDLCDALRNLNELIELKLCRSVVPVTKETVFRLIEIANKLQNLYYVGGGWEEIRYWGGYDIDKATFLRMVNIVKQRREKGHLALFLLHKTTVMSVSPSLVRANTDTITITLLHRRCPLWDDLLDSRYICSRC